MADIIGIGASVFDTLMLAENFPQEDTKLKAMSSKIQGGGPCATALVAAAQLGVSAEYFGLLGDDVYGRYMLDEFRRYGVECDSVRIVKNAASFNSFVLINKSNSSRTCVWNPGTLPSMGEADVPLDKLKAAKYLHLDGNHVDAAVFAAKKASEYQVKVSLDAGSPYPGIEKLLPLADILIPSEEFVSNITGKESPEEGAEWIYLKYKPEIFIITQGANGGFIFDGTDVIRYEPFSAEVVDTNGAGDTFHGAFLAARVRRMGLREAVNFASAAAAIKCRGFGARESIPSYDETMKAIKEAKA